MKLIVEEQETEALASAITGRAPYLSSVVGEIETRRSCMRANPRPPAEAVDAVLAPVSTIELDEGIAGVAALLDPPSLRALDAIHLASALALGDELDVLVTYNGTLADAATAAHLAVVSPR